jgi:trans-L-3-hydroxyproline dehydratase
VFADGQIDRSPTGTGVSGRLAIQHKRGNLEVGEEFAVESIVGSVFRGKITKTRVYAGYDAVVPQIRGSAYITGRNEFVIDPEDPLRDGFLIN